MSSTPRGSSGPSPRASKPAVKPADGKKVKKTKPKGSAPTAPISLGMPMAKAAELTLEDARKELEEVQKKYGVLVVNFNNQQAELAQAQNMLAKQEDEIEALKAQSTLGSADELVKQLRDQLQSATQELRGLEQTNMAQLKKINKLQVEHVSEEEVDQLFYALEKKEEELAQALQEKEHIEADLLTEKQLSARGGGGPPKYIEVHHHTTNSDSEGDDDEAAAPAAEAPAAPVEAS